MSSEASVVVMLIPSCGLVVEYEKEKRRDGIATYRITGPPEALDLAKQHGTKGDDDEDDYYDSNDNLLKGSMSPVAPLTLSAIDKTEVRIPWNCTQVAYIYPNAPLAQRIPWKDRPVAGTKTLEDAQEESFPNGIIDPSKEWGWKQALLMGGFVFFDRNNKFVCVHAISVEPTGYDFPLTGPFDVPPTLVSKLNHLGRMRGLTLGSLQEVGFSLHGWVHPGETLDQEQEHPEYEQDPQAYPPNQFGAFVLETDRGETLMYMVDPDQILELDWSPKVSGSTIQDAIAVHRPQTAAPQPSVAHILEAQPFFEEQPHMDEMYVTDTSMHLMQDDDDDEVVLDLTKLKRIMTCVDEEEKDGDDDEEEERRTTSITETTQEICRIYRNQMTLLHKACRLQSPTPIVQMLLNEPDIQKGLRHQDNFLHWTPLHYACRFSPTNVHIISTLIQADKNGDTTHSTMTENPPAVLRRDRYNRYPIHVACDSGASSAIIRLLLHAVDEGSSSLTLLQASRFKGWLPLHFACSAGASPNVVRTLLLHDRSGKSVTARSREGLFPLHLAIRRKANADIVRLLLDADSAGQSVHTSHLQHIGKTNVEILPIHAACINGLSADAIRLLLERDKEKKTIHCAVKGDPKDIGSPGWNISVRLASSMLPLHLACDRSPPCQQTINILLEADEAQTTVTVKDAWDRLPLHIALLRQASVVTIKDILFHHTQDQVREADNKGWYPLHYACRKGASAEVVDVLLAADESIGNQRKTESVEKRDGRGRVPFFYAVREGASDDALYSLMTGNRFILFGFDAPLLSQLAERVANSRKLQEALNRKSTNRIVLGWLILEVYFNCIVLFVFMKATQDVLNGSPTQREATTLFICGAYLLLGELIQAQHPFHYLSDIWNLIELTRTGLILATAVHLATKISANESDLNTNLLIAAGTFVVVGFILFLRSTFVSFATFVRGLIEVRCVWCRMLSKPATHSPDHTLLSTQILTTLFTFAVVTALLLLSFAYAFFVEQRLDGDGAVIRDLGKAYLYTLEGFFSGPNATQNIIDIIFGVIAVIVLLNVVIAIVSNAWDKAGEQAGIVFWNYRLTFLAHHETAFGPLQELCEHKFRMDGNDRISRFLRWIDSTKDIRIRDPVKWSAKPFDLVTGYEEYLKPDLYFSADVAELISNSRSLQGEIFWMLLEKPDNKSVSTMVVVGNWVGEAAFYGLLIVLGLPTLGILWPQRFRSALLGSNYSEQPIDPVLVRIEQLEDKVDRHVGTVGSELQADAVAAEHRLDKVDAKLNVLERKVEKLRQKLKG